MLDINRIKDEHSPTGATNLYSLMDIAVLVLLGHLVFLPYRQTAQTGIGNLPNALVGQHWYPCFEGYLKLYGHTCSASRAFELYDPP